jgi:uncharacterized integral membrane protein
MALRSTTSRGGAEHRVTVAAPGSVDRTPGPNAPDQGRPDRQHRANAFVWGLVVALAAVAIVALILQNDEEVIVDLLWWSIRLPLALVLFGSGVVGAIIAEGVRLGVRWRRHR